MNIMMIVAWIGEKIFGAGGSIARGLISAAVGIGSTIANMTYFQDWMAQGILTKFMDMSDEGVWGTVTIVNGSVEGTEFWATALNVYKAVAIVGFGLFLAYWFINLIEKSNQDRLNGNEFVRLGLQLVVGIALITYGPVLMHGISTFSGWSINVVLEGMTKSGNNGDGDGLPQHTTGNLYLDNALQWIGFRKGTGSIAAGNYCGKENKCDLCYIYVDGYERNNPRYGYTKNTGLLGAGGDRYDSDAKFHAWSDYGIGDAIGKILMGVIVLLINAFLTLIIIVLLVIISATALSRSIQIIIYVMFAPLAFADTFHQGFINSKSWRYIQKFLALCIQAGIIYASVILAPKIAGTLGNSIMSPDVPSAEITSPMYSQSGVPSLLPETDEDNDLVGDIIFGAGEFAVEIAGSVLHVVIVTLFTIIGYLTALGLSQKAAQISNDIIGV